MDKQCEEETSSSGELIANKADAPVTEAQSKQGQADKDLNTGNNEETEEVKDMSIDESSVLSDETMNESQEILNGNSKIEDTKPETQNQNTENIHDDNAIDHGKVESKESSDIVYTVESKTPPEFQNQNAMGSSAGVTYDESIYHLKWFDWKGKTNNGFLYQNVRRNVLPSQAQVNTLSSRFSQYCPRNIVI